MPSSTMTHEDKYRFPKDVPFAATLTKVEEQSFEYTIKNGPRKGEKDTFTKWSWEFEFTEGEFAGLHVWGDTEDRLTNRDDNKVRQWAEALRGVPFEMGEGLDTDDLIGLPCYVVLDHVEGKNKQGDPTYRCPVVSVIESDIPTEPPF